MALELALDWKRSLTLRNPILLASGDCVTEAPTIGALVTLPLTRRPRAGAPLPRVIEIPGGVLLRTGAANPGLSNVLREQTRAWAHSQIPIIVALAAQGINDWAALATQVEPIAGVGGIELHFNPTLDAVAALRAVRAATELPILVKLDLANAREIAAACVQAGANVLVIGRAPRGMRIVDGKPWFGRWYGPAAKPFALSAVADIAALKLAAPIIACGGVQSVEDAREFLAAGAVAVEIDSAEWLEPGSAEKIAGEINTPGTRVDAT